MSDETEDAKRLDWLDADAQRIERVFAATVRAPAGATLREIIDQLRKEELACDTVTDDLLALQARIGNA